jgi:peptide/nickel transport system substrate-binding protein
MNRRPPSRSPRFALLGALVGLGLVACAPAAPPSSAKPGASASAPGGQAAGPAAAPVSPEKIVRGGTFIVGMHGDLVNFDSITQTGALHLSVMGLVQSGLMKWGKTTVVDPTKLACDLCESWTQIDPVTYEFKLRQGVRWHNLPPTNGREFVAEDMKYTLERLQTANFKNDPRFGRQQPKAAGIASIETPDKYTVRVHLKEPNAAFLWHMGDPFILMVAREQVEAEAEGILRSGLVGTGPFMLKEFTPKVSYTLVRNPDYFMPGLPYLDGVEVRVIMDNTTRANAFRAREIHDPGMFMDAEKKRIVDRSHPDLYMGEVPGMTAAGIYFNTTRPPLDDARVRRAIHLAIDRQALIDATRFGRAVLTRWLPPSVGIYATPEEQVAKMPGYRQPKDEDVATARRLLAEAGYPNGFSVELKVIRSANIPADAEVIAEQLRQALNLDVKLVLLERAVHEKETQSGNYQMSIEYALSSAGDPGEALGQVLSYSGANYGQWKNARYDELWAKQQAALDPAERTRLIGQMMDILDEEAPVTITYTDNNYRGYPRGCHGIQEEHRYNVLLRYMSEVWCDEGVLRR